LGAADFRIRAEIADQDNFVDAACHDLTPLARLFAKSRWPQISLPPVSLPPVLLPISLAARPSLAHQVQLNRDADNAGYTHRGKNHRRYPHQSRAAPSAPGQRSLFVLVNPRPKCKGAGRTP
jgi:hypothetical protein